MTPLPGTSDDLAARHLEAWAGSLLGERQTLKVRGGDDPALAGAAGWEAVAWLDAAAGELPIEPLRSAADAGVRLVLGVRDVGRAEAERLAGRLGATVAGEQHLVQGSLVVGPGERPRTTPASVDDGGNRPRRVLLTANVDAVELERASSAQLAPALESVHGAQLERLEAAYWSLRRANARLARENLGRHDAAAASVVGPLTTELEHLRTQLAIEVEVARRNDEYFQAARAKLEEPHHRAAERLSQVLSAVPGGRALTRRALSRGR